MKIQKPQTVDRRGMRVHRGGRPVSRSFPPLLFVESWDVYLADAGSRQLAAGMGVYSCFEGDHVSKVDGIAIDGRDLHADLPDGDLREALLGASRCLDDLADESELARGG